MNITSSQHCLTLSHIVSHYLTLSHTISHCLTLSHTISHCLTLSHTISHCLTLSHIALHYADKSCLVKKAPVQFQSSIITLNVSQMSVKTYQLQFYTVFGKSGQFTMLSPTQIKKKSPFCSKTDAINKILNTNFYLSLTCF